MTHSNNIIEILTTETFALKQDLLVKTHTYAFHEFPKIINMIPEVNAKLDRIVEEFNEAVLAKSNAVYYLKKEYTKFANRLEKMKKIQKNGMTAFVEECMKDAEAHYSDSLLKLAERINQKGMDMTNFQLTSGYVGINLEMTMTDGVKSLKAWTIWAAQDSVCMKPHYRYLVK